MLVMDYNNQFITHEVKKMYLIDSVTSVYNNLDEVDVIIILLCIDSQ